MLVSHTQLCIVYVVKEVASLQGLGELMGVACNRTCTAMIDSHHKAITGILNISSYSVLNYTN